MNRRDILKGRHQGEPLQPELARLDGKAIRYLAPVPAGVTVTSPIGGFGEKAGDYDFTVTNTASGFGQRIRPCAYAISRALCGMRHGRVFPRLAPARALRL